MLMPGKSAIYASAKTIIRLALNAWAGNPNIISDASTDIGDIVKIFVEDEHELYEVQHILEGIRLKVAGNLYAIFDRESSLLQENIKLSVAKSVEDTLNTITAEILASCDFDAWKLSTYLLTQYPSSYYSLSENIAEELYKRMIRDCCTCIIDVAESFPTFHKSAFTEILQRQTEILKYLEQVLQKMQSWHEGLQEQTLTYERSYTSELERKLNRLELLGTTFKLVSRELNLMDAYITLSVSSEKQDIMGNPYLSTNHQRIIQHTPVSINEALKYSKRIFICGDAGSGKTTLLQWIAVKAVQKSFPEILKDWNVLIPFYIRLRRQVTLHEQGPQIRIPELAEFPCFTDYFEKAEVSWVKNLLLSGRALVLIDGIDEVPEILRPRVREWLEFLVSTYKKAYFVVTSRGYAVNKENDSWTSWINQMGFDVATLQPMSWPGDITLFIDQWYKAIEKQEIDKARKANLPVLAESLKQELQHERPKRDLAKTPLLCAMLCALKREGEREGEQRLPSNRGDLYQACCKLLIESRENARNVPIKVYPASELLYEQKLAILRNLAYWMMQNELSEVERAEVDNKFQEELQILTRIPILLNDADGGKKVREFFVERSSIIREPIPGNIDFTHRTFQEFLAAKEAIKRHDTNYLIKHAHKDTWREVVLLVAQSLEYKSDWEAFIKGLIAEGDNSKEDSPKLYLLAAACLDSGVEDGSPTIKNLISTKLNTLLPLQTVQNVEVLQKAGTLAIPYLSNNIRIRSDVKAACIKALVSIGGEETLPILEGYTKNPDELVSYELWRAWQTFEGLERTQYEERVLSELLACPSKNYLLPVEHLSSLQDFQKFTKLVVLHLGKCQNIADITPLASLTELESLYLYDCTQLRNIQPIKSLTSLTKLGLTGCNQLKKVEPLESLFQLTLLQLQECSRLHDISFLKELSKLTDLSLGGCSSSTNFSTFKDIQTLDKLASLQLSACSSLHNAEVLSNFWSLTHIDLSLCQNLDNINDLRSLPRLHQLRLSGCTSLYDLSVVASLPLLNELYLSDCKALHYLPDFTRNTALHILDLSRCPLLDDLRPLSSLPQLKQLYLTGCPKVIDLKPLADIPTLQEVYLAQEEFRRMKKPRRYRFEIKEPHHNWSRHAF